MRPVDRSRLEAIAKKLSTGEGPVFTVDQFAGMLATVRDEAPPTSMLRDLASSINHPKRDKGAIHKYLQGFVDHWESIVNSAFGGKFEVTTVYPIETIIDDLNRLLTAEGIPYQLDRKSRGVRMVLAYGIAQALNGTEFVLRGRAATAIVRPDDDGNPQMSMVIPELTPPKGVENDHKFAGFAVPWLLNGADSSADWSKVIAPKDEEG